MSDISFKDFLIKSKFNIANMRKLKSDYEKIKASGLFDENFYLESYPHIAKENIDPLLHYIVYGFKEGKLPSPQFNLNEYLKQYPEVKNEDINPLIYYIDNNHKGFTVENPCVIKKNKILATNKLFLKNYEFEKEPLVSIIILNRNGLNHLKRLFTDFQAKTNYSNYEIIVVDNASCDESVEYLYSLDLNIKIIENSENLSFSKCNNDAAKIANGEYLLLLNNDIEPTYGWLNEMMGVMLNNDNVGSVGAKLVFPHYSDDLAKSFSIQHAGVKFREEITPYIYGPYHENMFLTLLFSDKVNHQKEVIANTAACLLIPKEVYVDLGGLDENYVYGYEDIDFAFKLYKNGFKSIYTPFALLFHHESATRVEDIDQKNQLNYQNIMYFYSKWGDFLFKEILKDKINNNHFITDKKLDISIICENNEFITNLVKNLNNKGYNVKLIPNLNNLDIGQNCDIVVSTNSQYNIDKITSRLNIIKVLLSDENNDKYDIIFNKNEDLIDIIKKKYL